MKAHTSTKIYYEWGDFDFDLINFPFPDGDALRRTSYGIFTCLFQHIRFLKASSHVSDLTVVTNAYLTDKLLKQGYRYLKVCKVFFKVLSPILWIDGNI